MIAVIFEVEPGADGKNSYFSIAEELKPILVEIDGFISVERFESVNMPGKYLSLSFWRDEKAVLTWRNQLEHRKAQQAGRLGIFYRYRIRVAQVVRDYGIDDRAKRQKTVIKPSLDALYARTGYSRISSIAVDYALSSFLSRSSSHSLGFFICSANARHTRKP